MKQITQNYKSGELKLSEVPSPMLRPGGVLVRNHASLISAGTEKTKVDTARMSLLKKAQSRPDQVRKVLATLKKEGVFSTYQKVMGKLDALTPLGYSSAGVVMAVGEGVTEFRVGDRVACAGAGYANHAEVVYVPRNLCVHVPDEVEFCDAAFATLGAIALQGVRQADLRLGETVAVIGLGLLGQLAVQLLKASGCKVLGIDIDPHATALARENGADLVGTSAHDDLAAQLTGGRGLDAVLITAGTKGNGPIELAPRLLRERGRVVVLGAVGMNVPREPYYMKELELRLSRSYGPGRYDARYEEKGQDYPYAYVRWTEQRNLDAFVQLLAAGKVDVRRLTTHRFKLADAQQAYNLISGRSQERYLGIVLEYDTQGPIEHAVTLREVPAPPVQGNVGIGMIGAGNFARAMILPHLRREARTSFRGIQTASGLTAREIGDRFGFALAAASPAQVLEDASTQAVFIMTRHNTHAELACQALEAGKAVFLEKPMALNQLELERVVETWSRVNGRLMVGFNRRFSSCAEAVAKHFEGRTYSLAVQIRVNAGAIARDHWIQDPEEGGGRIVGEMCHFVDLAVFLTGSKVERVFAEGMLDPATGSVVDDVVALTLRHEDGSVSSISYFANGDTSQPKERVEVYGGGAMAVIDDFKVLTLVRAGQARRRKFIEQDKGHAAEVAGFMAAVRAGTPMPIPFEQLVNVTSSTLRAIDSLRTGAPMGLNGCQE